MTRASKWGAGLFIWCYLLVLSSGIVAHALKVGMARNALSYFVVWDMFCGWQAYDQRLHFIAETSDGRYFDVEEPWGAFRPFGHVGRVHYDFSSRLLSKHINHIVSHTAHDPFDCVYIVQECWPKQYNLPDAMWEQNFCGPRDKMSYYHLRAVCDSRGDVMNLYPDWYQQQKLNSIADNPRVRHQARQSRSSFGVLYTPPSGSHSSHGTGMPDGLELQPATN